MLTPSKEVVTELATSSWNHELLVQPWLIPCLESTGRVWEVQDGTALLGVPRREGTAQGFVFHEPATVVYGRSFKGRVC